MKEYKPSGQEKVSVATQGLRDFGSTYKRVAYCSEQFGAEYNIHSNLVSKRKKHL